MAEPIDPTHVPAQTGSLYCGGPDSPAAGHADEREVEAVARAIRWRTPNGPKWHEEAARVAITALDAVRADAAPVVFDCAHNNARYAQPCDRCPVVLRAELERTKVERDDTGVALVRMADRAERAEAELRQARNIIADLIEGENPEEGTPQWYAVRNACGWLARKGNG